MTGSRPRESYSVSKGNAAILGSPFALPETISFKAYAEVFTQYDFQIYTLNSFIISSVATLVSLMIYAMAAYVFAKFTFPGRNIIYVLFTVTLLVPPHAKAQPIFSLVLNLSLYDTRAALALVYLSMGLAMSMFIFRATFTVTTVSKALNEYPDVNESTCAGIHDIAREMGYTANPIASRESGASAGSFGSII